MARYVLSDASPLIGLAIVDGLAWLPALFNEVWIPPSVQREVLPGVGARGELDERAGRAIAAELGIRVTGTAAVIGFAKRHGLIDSAKARFECLHASDFRISADVIQTVLRGVGELS